MATAIGFGNPKRHAEPNRRLPDAILLMKFHPHRLEFQFHSDLIQQSSTWRELSAHYSIVFRVKFNNGGQKPRLRNPTARAISVRTDDHCHGIT